MCAKYESSRRKKLRHKSEILGPLGKCYSGRKGSASERVYGKLKLSSHQRTMIYNE